MSGPDIQLITPESSEDWQETRLVLRDYANSLDVDLCFQGFEEELAGLPGVYAPPGGLMLLDTLDDMEAARGLYESLGFVEVPPFYFNPIPGAHYLKAELGAFRPSYFG